MAESIIKASIIVLIAITTVSGVAIIHSKQEHCNRDFCIEL
jgi:hypothetical protein